MCSHYIEILDTELLVKKPASAFKFKVGNGLVVGWFGLFIIPASRRLIV